MKCQFVGAILAIAGIAAFTAAVIGDLPGALASRSAAAARTGEVRGRQELNDAQMAAADDVVARLVGGEFTLAEAAGRLERGSDSSGIPSGVAQAYPGATARQRWAGYAVDKARRLLEGDEAKWSSVSARLDIEFRALADDPNE